MMAEEAGRMARLLNPGQPCSETWCSVVESLLRRVASKELRVLKNSVAAGGPFVVAMHPELRNLSSTPWTPA
jgi:hypothetical protein